MSLEVLLKSALGASEEDWVHTGPEKVCADAVITAIQETPLRVEVFEKAEQKVLNGEFSMMDVHAVLDALVEVLQGE